VNEIQSTINKSNEEVFSPVFSCGVCHVFGVVLLLQLLLVVVDLFIIHFLEVLLFHLSLLMNKGPF